MMAPRDPLAFLDAETPQRKTLLLLLALIRKQGGEVSLSLDDLTAIEDGASYHKYPSDTGVGIVLRYARKGAEAYFLSAAATEDKPSTRDASRSTVRAVTPRSPLDEDQLSPSPQPARHSVHNDVDLALREEEMAQRARTAMEQRVTQARREAGAMPWRTKQ
jgi:hypothetical protein